MRRLGQENARLVQQWQQAFEHSTPAMHAHPGRHPTPDGQAAWEGDGAHVPGRGAAAAGGGWGSYPAAAWQHQQAGRASGASSPRSSVGGLLASPGGLAAQARSGAAGELDGAAMRKLVAAASKLNAKYKAVKAQLEVGAAGDWGRGEQAQPGLACKLTGSQAGQQPCRRLPQGSGDRFQGRGGWLTRGHPRGVGFCRWSSWPGGSWSIPAMAAAAAAAGTHRSAECGTCGSTDLWLQCCDVD
jgi:hypothetical protein